MADEQTFEENLGMQGPCGACNKLCGALGTMCVGFALFPLSLFLVGWNENNFVCENARILYAESRADAIGCSSSGVSEKFAFLSCPVVESSLRTFTPCNFNSGMGCGASQDLPLSFQSASGSQKVEMYQCMEECNEETRRNSAGQNTKVRRCTYSMEWSERRHDSSDYHESPDSACPDLQAAGGNPEAPLNLILGPSMPTYAETILVGDTDAAFTLNSALVQRLTPDTQVPLANYTGSFSGPSSGHAWSRPLTVSSSNLFVSGNYLKTCTTDKLGCVRISYRKSVPTDLSVITRVTSGGQTEAEDVPGGWGCSATTWQSLRKGSLDKAEMIETLHDDNQTMTWILRMLGVLLAWAAVYCCFAPLTASADVLGDFINLVPCGGCAESLLEGVMQWVVCTMSCGIGCSCALLVMGLVWVLMRPLVGGLLLAACACCFAAAILVRSQVSGKTKLPQGGEEPAPSDV